jgi:hypothetical protein
MKQVSVELSKDELKELITSLEAANKVSHWIIYLVHLLLICSGA